jgi:hypothetical protein
MKMPSPVVNSVWDPIQLLFFVAAVVLVLGAVRKLPFMDVLNFFLWLFSYPALAALAFLGTLIAFGLVGRDYGLQYCFYPDGTWAKVAAAALMMVLFCETLALSYLRDHVEYGYSSKARTRANVAILRARLMLYQWLLLRWMISIFPQRSDDAWLRYLGGEEIDALRRRPGTPVAELDTWPGRRLKATLAVVATQALLLMGVIAAVAVLAVIKEGGGHLGDRSNWGHIAKGLACYAAGLPAGWLVSIFVTWVVVGLVPGATQREASTVHESTDAMDSRRSARRRAGFALSLVAAAYLAALFFAPAVRFSFSWFFLAVLIAWLIWGWLRARRGDEAGERQSLGESAFRLVTGATGAWAPLAIVDPGTRRTDSARSQVYAVSIVIAYLLPCVVVTVSRAGHPAIGSEMDFDNQVFTIGLAFSLIFSALFLARTRLRAPESAIAIPALFVQGFLGICILYMYHGETAPFQKLVALPMTCLLGATVALFFFIAYLLPGRLATGAAACSSSHTWMVRQSTVPTRTRRFASRILRRITIGRSSWTRATTSPALMRKSSGSIRDLRAPRRPAASRPLASERDGSRSMATTSLSSCRNISPYPPTGTL